MLPILQTLSAFIKNDLLVTFGFYSILYFIISYFSKNKKWLADFDQSSCRLVIFLIWIYVLLWILNNVFHQYLSVELSIIERFLFLAPALLWFGLSYLFTKSVFQNSLIFRLILSFSFAFTFEHYVILVTSIHSNFLPSSWSYNYSWGEIVAGIFLKVVLFVAIVGIYRFVKSKVIERLDK